MSLIRETAECIAKLDVFTSFASVAVEHNYVCPVMNESGDFFVKNGRHPVLEQILPLGNFVANDIELSSTDTYFFFGISITTRFSRSIISLHGFFQCRNV